MQLFCPSSYITSCLAHSRPGFAYRSTSGVAVHTPSPACPMPSASPFFFSGNTRARMSAGEKQFHQGLVTAASFAFSFSRSPLPCAHAPPWQTEAAGACALCCSGEMRLLQLAQERESRKDLSAKAPCFETCCWAG